MNAADREDRQSRRYKRYTAYSIIILSLYTFFLCTNGFISGLTGDYKTLLFDWLGKTNKWSGSYGSESLVEILRGLSLLGSPIFVSLFSVVFGGYLYIRKKYRTLYTYFLVVIGGGFFHVLLKNYFAGEPWYNWFNLFIINGKEFPSGHAFMSVVLYFTLGRLIYRANPEVKLNRYLITVAILLNISIDISLIIQGAHSPNEVIAGWSMGIAWISGAWLLDHFIRKRIYIRHHLKNADLTKT